MLVPVIFHSEKDSTFTTDLPHDKEYDLIRSWIKRAYPIASAPNNLQIDDEHNDPLDINVDDLSDSDPAKSAESNYRNAPCDVTNYGVRTDRLMKENRLFTHYVGLVSDHKPGGGIGNAEYLKNGCSTIMGLQTSLQVYFSQPGSVATGYRGKPEPPWATTWPSTSANFWDNDGSYGDWYTGHELAHSLGRFHAKGSSGADFPSPPPSLCDQAIVSPQSLPSGHPNGQLSDSTEFSMGFDSGDPNQP